MIETGCFGFRGWGRINRVLVLPSDVRLLDMVGADRMGLRGRNGEGGSPLGEVGGSGSGGLGSWLWRRD